MCPKSNPLMDKKKAVSVYLRNPVRKFIEGRLKDKKYPYRTLSHYLEAMALLDEAGGVPHQFLSDIVNRPEWAREELLAELRKKIADCKKKNSDNW